MHTHVVESPLQVYDAKVQQQKTVYVIHVFYLAVPLTSWLATTTADPRSWRISCFSRKYFDWQWSKLPSR